MSPNEPDAPLQERREHERKRLLRSYAELLFEDHAPVIVRTINISQGGVAITVDCNPPIGMILRLRLALPVREGPNKRFTLLAHVITCVYSADEGGFKLGLQFLDMPAGMDTVIRDYLKAGAGAGAGMVTM